MDLNTLVYKSLKYLVVAIIIYFLIKYSFPNQYDNIDIAVLSLIFTLVIAIIDYIIYSYFYTQNSKSENYHTVSPHYTYNNLKSIVDSTYSNIEATNFATINNNRCYNPSQSHIINLTESDALNINPNLCHKVNPKTPEQTVIGTCQRDLLSFSSDLSSDLSNNGANKCGESILDLNLNPYHDANNHRMNHQILNFNDADNGQYNPYYLQKNHIGQGSIFSRADVGDLLTGQGNNPTVSTREYFNSVSGKNDNSPIISTRWPDDGGGAASGNNQNPIISTHIPIDGDSVVSEESDNSPIISTRWPDNGGGTASGNNQNPIISTHIPIEGYSAVSKKNNNGKTVEQFRNNKQKNIFNQYSAKTNVPINDTNHIFIDPTSELAVTNGLNTQGSTTDVDNRCVDVSTDNKWYEQRFNPRDYSHAENLDQIHISGNRTRDDILVNELRYSDFNRMPPSFNKDDFEYGYSMLPPKDWYPLPPYPPICSMAKSCPVYSTYSDDGVANLKEWHETQKITPPDAFNTDFIRDQLNSKM